MDVSKLPRLSDSKAAEPAVASAVTGTVSDAPVPVGYGDPYTRRPLELGADVWISTVIGLLFVGLGLTFGKYAVSRLAHQPFSTGIEWTDGPKAGQPVGYFELSGHTAWSDAGAFFFGLTLLAEAATKAAVVLRPGRATRAGLGLAMGLTLVTVLLNLGVCGLMFNAGILPLLSGLAVAFGGWVLFDEWDTLRRTRPIGAGATAVAGTKV